MVSTKGLSNQLNSSLHKARLFLFPERSEVLLEKGIYIDPVFFKTAIADRWLLGMSVEKVKVSELRRKMDDSKEYRLEDVPLYTYLNNRDKVAKDKQFEKLIQNIESNGFDPKSYIICKYKSNIIKDGAHRSVYMLWKYGPDYEVNVLHVRLKKNLLRFKIFPWLKGKKQHA